MSGGTWDLFRYPGVRSDSDMFTLGYRWRPWRGDKALADGPSILGYVRDVAQEYGVDQLIRYGHQVVRADWDSDDRALDGRGRDADGIQQISTGFLLGCTRLLRLRAAATRRSSRARTTSRGQVVHPQHWPEDLDYAGKRVVVIGSGATAVTLVPGDGRRTPGT